MTARVEPFSRDLVRGVLDEMGLHYLRDRDDDLIVDFERDEETGRQIRLWLIAGGPEEDVFQVLIHADRTFSDDESSAMLVAVNEWNDTRRWPQVALTRLASGECKITGSFALPVKEGIHAPLLRHVIETMIAVGHDFWVWLGEEHGIV